MQAALARLPEKQRAAIALFHFQGLSGREAAQAMNLSEKAFEFLADPGTQGAETDTARRAGGMKARQR